MQHLCGWIPPSERTKEQHAAHEAAMATIPRVEFYGAAGDAPDKVVLTDFWKHPLVKASLGYEFPGWLQFTGSCVGVGLANAIETTAICDAILRGDQEGIELYFWGLAYGRSRYYAGMRGQGEGSLGATAAQAARDDGFLACTFPGLPTVTNANETVSIPKADELKWSDGGTIGSQFLSESRKHVIKSTAEITRVTDLRQAIQSGYAATIACPKYCDTPVVKGSTPVLIGRMDGDGGHQQSVHAVANHPDCGWIYGIMNTWPRSKYPVDPYGMPHGGYWVAEDTMSWMIANGECFAFSGDLNGFPVRQLTHVLL